MIIWLFALVLGDKREESPVETGPVHWQGEGSVLNVGHNGFIYALKNVLNMFEFDNFVDFVDDIAENKTTCLDVLSTVVLQRHFVVLHKHLQGSSNRSQSFFVDF